jgi:hypothetical protein
MLTCLSKRVVDAATPAPREYFLWDQTVKGFGAGAKFYVLQYRCKGRQRRYRIGRHGSPWTADEARTEAVRLLAEVVRSDDPADLKRAERGDFAFSAFADRYLCEHALLHKKPRSAELDRWLLRAHILPAIGSRRLRDISRSDIARMRRDLAETPIAANRVLGLTAAMFTRAQRAGDCAKKAATPADTLKNSKSAAGSGSCRRMRSPASAKRSAGPKRPARRRERSPQSVC